MPLLLLLGGLVTGCLGPPDTFGDMRIRLDELHVPADFTFITEDQIGLRGGFAAAPAPSL